MIIQSIDEFPCEIAKESYDALVRDALRWRKLIIGGNHLASALIEHGIHPTDWVNYDQIIERFGQPWADIWIAWKGIMDCAQEAQQSLDKGLI